MTDRLLVKPPVTLDCPECEVCCAIGLCCPQRAAQVDAMANLLLDDPLFVGKPELARETAEAYVRTHHDDEGGGARRDAFRASVQEIIAMHAAVS